MIEAGVGERAEVAAAVVAVVQGNVEAEKLAVAVAEVKVKIIIIIIIIKMIHDHPQNTDHQVIIDIVIIIKVKVEIADEKETKIDSIKHIDIVIKAVNQAHIEEAVVKLEMSIHQIIDTIIVIIIRIKKMKKRKNALHLSTGTDLLDHDLVKDTL